MVRDVTHAAEIIEGLSSLVTSKSGNGHGSE